MKRLLITVLLLSLMILLGRMNASPTEFLLSAQEGHVLGQNYVQSPSFAFLEGNLATMHAQASSVRLNAQSDGYTAYSQTLAGREDTATYPARNVQAEIAGGLENQAVNVSWQAPIIGSTILSHPTVNDEFRGYKYGGVWDDIPAQNGAFHRFTQEQLVELGVSGQQLTHIMFWVDNRGGTFSTATDFELKVYTGGSNPSGDTLIPGTLAYSQPIPDSEIRWNQYTTVELTTPFTIPTTGELWFGYSLNLIDWSSAVMTADVQPTGAPIRFGDIYYVDFSGELYWMTLYDVDGYRHNFLIKGLVQDMNSRTVEIGETDTTSYAYREPRNLLSYNVYRSNVLDIDDEELWVTVAANIPHIEGVENYSFVDITWGSIEKTWDNIHDGRFIYIVKAVFAENALSEPSRSLQLMQIPPGKVYIGDYTWSTRSQYVPFNYQIATNWAQTIYKADEINMERGAISEIEFYISNWNSNAASGRPIMIWMGNIPASQQTFPNGTSWVSWDDLELVYDNTFYGPPSGTVVLQPYTFTLDESFIYEGGNLVIMTFGGAHTGVSNANNTNRQFATNQNRTIYRNSAVVTDLVPYGAFGSGTRNLTTVPNITLTFDSVLGAIAGTITSDDEPVEGVTVALEGTLRTTVTDADGYYALNFVTPGVYTVTAKKIGFLDTIEEGVEIVPDTTTTLNMIIDPSPEVIVRGRVIGSDTDAPVVGAVVTISGYADFPSVTTDALGLFEVQGVFIRQIYTLTIAAPPVYVIYRNENMQVGITDLDLGDVMIKSFVAAPRNLMVTEDGFSAVNLSWTPPPPPGELSFSHVTGTTFSAGIGVTDGAPVIFTPAMRFSSEHLSGFGVIGTQLTKIAFYPNNTQTPTGNASFTLRVWTGGGGSPLNPGELIYSQPIPASSIVWNQWNDFVLDEPVTIPTSGELWIGYEANVTSGFVASVTNGTPINNFSNVVQWNNNWTSLSSIGGAGIEGWLLRGTAMIAGREVAISPISYSLEEILGIGVTYEIINDSDEIAQLYVATDSQSEIGATGIRSTNNMFERNATPRNEITYNIYRANIKDIENPALWTPLAMNYAPADANSPTFVDDTWSEAPIRETFRWIVTTAAMNDNESYPSISRRMIKTPIGGVVIGNQESQVWDSNMPFDLSRRSSLSQVLYLAEEIGPGGYITHISYWFNSRGDITTNKEIALYMTNVGKEVESLIFPRGWLPFEMFTEVFDGYIGLNLPHGEHLITVELQEPFLYEGNNLVIYAWQKHHITNWDTQNMWLRTATPGIIRGLFGHSTSLTPANSLFPQNPPMDGTGGQYPHWGALGFTNIMFEFNTGGLGHIQGIVTTGEDATPVEGVEINITDTDRSVFTDAEGRYYLEFVPMGSTNFTVSRHGYITKFVDVNIIEDETIFHDIEIDPMHSIMISGRVLASDTGAALVGAIVKLEGYEDYTDIVTNAQGIFDIPGVYSGYTYTLTVTRLGYHPHENPNVMAATLNITIPDIVLTEIPFRPKRVEARIETHDEGTVARVAWTEPGPEDVMFSFVTTNTTGYLVGMNNSNIEVVHRYGQTHLQNFGVSGADLTEVHFLTGSNAVLTECNVIIYTAPAGYEEATAVSGIPRTLVHRQDVPLSSLIQSGSIWNTIALTTPVSIPTSGELWISINYVIQTGNPAATNTSPSVNRFSNVMKVNQGFGDVWGTLITMASADYSWMIRGYAENVIRSVTFGHDETVPSLLRNDTLPLAPPSSPTFMETPPSPPTFMGGAGGGRNTDTSTLSDIEIQIIPISEIETSHSVNIPPSNRNIRDTRALESFSIWRTIVNQNNTIPPETQWTPIITGFTDFEYLDATWETLAEGRYRYGVRAFYSNEVYSDIRWSNDVYRDLSDVFMPPKNFIGEQIPDTYDVLLSWEVPDFVAVNGEPTGYRLSRNSGEPITITELTYTDNDLTIGNHKYSITAIYATGESEAVEINVDVIPVSDFDHPIVIATALKGNYPNPFNPSTTIAFEIKEEGVVKIDVFNIRGQRVTTLVNEFKSTGRYTVDWYGIDENGRSVASGIYFYQMKAEGFMDIQRMLLMK